MDNPDLCFYIHERKMLHRSSSILFLLILISSFVNGQDEKSPITKYLIKRGYEFPESGRQKLIPDSLKQWPDTLFYNTLYKAKLLASPTIPISFSKIVSVNGEYEVTPTISIGYGYTWFFGDFIFNENDKITVDPGFFFGAIASVGVQNNFDLRKPAGFFTGGFIGFGPFSLFFGYDFISQSASIGLGGRIDLYTISQNFLKPIGKVREKQKHRKIAPIIENE